MDTLEVIKRLENALSLYEHYDIMSNIYCLLEELKREYPQYRLVVNQLTTAIPWNKDKDYTIETARFFHRMDPDKYHEVYRLNHDGKRYGIFQLKPGDCEHGFPYGANCKHCNPYIGLHLLFPKYLDFY